MEILNFLDQKLSDLATNFPQINVKYCYNDEIDSYIVEITPKIEFERNEDLDEAWMLIAGDFMNEFPHEDIIFISSDSNLLEGSEVHCINSPSSLVDQEFFSDIQEPIINNVIEYEDIASGVYWDSIENYQSSSDMPDSATGIDMTSNADLNYEIHIEVEVKQRKQPMKLTPLAA